MIRTLAIGMILLVQMIIAIAPGGVVLCIHDDGHWFLESAATPCCRVCPRAGQRPDGALGGGPAVAQDRGGGEDDHCRDFALGASESRSPVVGVSEDDTRRMGDLMGPAPGMAIATGSPMIAAVGEEIRETGPPRPPREPALLRTVHLRC